jgi:hypothetical protein
MELNMTTRFFRRAGLPALLLVPAGALALSRAPVPMAEGWTFVWNVTSDAPVAQNSTMQVRLLTHQMRVDFRTGTMPGMPPGGYMLIDAEKGQMVMVSPQEKTATLFALGGMGTAMGQMAAGAQMKMEATDISISVDDLGPGEAILGHPTHKYRLKQNYTLNMSTMGMQQSTRTESTTETWMSTDFPEAELRAFEGFNKTFGQSAGGIAAMGGEGMKKLNEELQAKMPKGFPLKQIVTGTMTMQGRSQAMRTTMEVASMSKGTLEPSLFEIPEGYKVNDMTKMLQEMMKKPPQ